MPDIVHVSDRRIDIGTNARTEKGPLRRTAMASAELFAQEELQLSTLETRLKSDYQLGSFDSDGNVIVAGQEFAFLDHYGDHVWHVYELCIEEWVGATHVVRDENGEPVPDPENPEKFLLEVGPEWRRRGWYATQAEAVAAGVVIDQAHGG